MFSKISGRKISKKPRFSVELLENRDVPATFTFSAATSNNWNDPTNWTVTNGTPAGTTPSTNDDVVIGTQKTVNFNVSGTVTIHSLDMRGQSILDLGKTTTANTVSLIVDGGNSTIGTNTASATIKSVDGYNANPTSGGVANYNAQLKFTGAGVVTVNVANFLFESKDTADKTKYNTQNLTFANSKVTFNYATELAANVKFGGATTKTLAQMNTGNDTLNMNNTGNIVVDNKGTFELFSGGIKQPATNTKQLLVVNKLVVTGFTNVITVDPTIVGVEGTTPLIIISSGKLKAKIFAKGQTRVISWAGSTLDSSAGTSVFDASSNFDIVSDTGTPIDPELGTVVAGVVSLKGNFTFAGNETFHAFTLAKPNSADPTDWTFGSFTTTPALISTVLSADDNGHASWTGTGDKMNFDVYIDSVGNAYYGTLAGGTITESGSTLNVKKTGGAPSAYTNLKLITSAANALSLGFSTVNYVGYSWNVWNPNSLTYGIKNY